jgi:peptide/nickel transport system permease protein
LATAAQRRWLDTGWLAAGLLVLLAAASVVGPWLSGRAYSDRVGPVLERPTASNWLGTDELGRDVLVRLLYAGRVSLAVGFAAALLAALAGAAVGLVAGMRGGWLDHLLMRTADGFMAVPTLPVLLVLAGIDLELPLDAFQNRLGRPDLDLPHSAWLYAGRLIVAMAMFSWMTTARLVRATVVSLWQREFVLAARALGVTGWRIAWRHLLPHCLGPVLVALAGAVGTNILYDAVLGFLGLGIPPPTPSWGGMLQSARVYSYYRAPWLIYFPGLCITLTVLAVNVLSDRLQEWADPRRR